MGAGDALLSSQRVAPSAGKCPALALVVRSILGNERMLAVRLVSDSDGDYADQEPNDRPGDRPRDPDFEHREPCRRRIREQPNDQPNDAPDHTEGNRTDNDESRKWRGIAEHCPHQPSVCTSAALRNDRIWLQIVRF